MTQFDKIYKDIVNEILTTGTSSHFYGGVRTKYADGTAAHYISKYGLHFKLNVDWNNPETFPLLTSRYTPIKSAFREIAWIWLFRSNNVKDLREKLECKFWDEWEREDNTIGKAYGYQIAKPVLGYDNQLSYIVKTLQKDPNSRRAITEIWVPSELEDMVLTPCVHLTQWSISDNKLILEVRARSTDVGLGLVSNVAQYCILQKLVADEIGVEVGEFIWSSHNYHIYTRHANTLQKQVESTQEAGDWKLVIPENFPSLLKDWDINNPEDVDFVKGVHIEGYKPSDFPKYTYEVAI